MIPEVPPDQIEEGLVAVGGGWFVINARDAGSTSRTRSRASTASLEETTQGENVASAEVPEAKPTRYRYGWLPS